MEYLLRRNKRQKSLRMHFSDKGQLIVSVPYRTSQNQINEFVSKNVQWIEDHKTRIPIHSYQNNDIFCFMGEKAALYVVKSKENNVELMDGKLILTAKNPENPDKVKKILYLFYSSELYKTVRPIVEKWSVIMGIQTPEIKISNAKTSWGVCYPKKNQIRFSAMTASLDKDLIEMICVHELCHFFYCNHSSMFWNKVAFYIPDVREKEKRLKSISKSGIARNMF